MKIANMLILVLGLSIASFGFSAVKVQCEIGDGAVVNSIEISGLRMGADPAAVGYLMSVKGSGSQPAKPLSEITGTSMCSLLPADGRAFEVTCNNGRHVRVRWAFIKGGFNSSRNIVYTLSLRDMNDNSHNAGEVLGATTCVIK